ncbi:MAG TPA: TlpA disulfide reductase family protein, partial [Puia sp.]|nr:TlpA disulfide reductase family protein [Puia sp.]
VQCAEKKKQAVMGIVQLQQGTDSLASQKLALIDQDWQDCVEDADLPVFRASTIRDEVIDSRALKGKIVVINFWFTSCAPCVAELPGLNRLVQEYQGKNVVFIGFTFEGKKKIMDEFFPEHPFDFKIVSEAASMEKIFGVDDYPSTFIVDPWGKIRKAWSGGTTGPEAKNEVYLKASHVIDALLKEKNKESR